MSNDSASVSPSPDAGPEAAPLDRFLDMLQEGMDGVMADDTPPLKKANALARLGNLYLKTYHTAERQCVNAEREERVAELEERVAELEERLMAFGVETAAGEEAVDGQTAPEDDGRSATGAPEKRKPAKPCSHGSKRPARRHHSRPGPRQKGTGGR